MPFSEEFESIQKRYIKREKDYAKGLTKAFKFAFEKGIKTVDHKESKNNPKSRKEIYF